MQIFAGFLEDVFLSALNPAFSPEEKGKLPGVFRKNIVVPGELSALNVRAAR